MQMKQAHKNLPDPLIHGFLLRNNMQVAATQKDMRDQGFSFGTQEMCNRMRSIIAQKQPATEHIEVRDMVNTSIKEEFTASILAAKRPLIVHLDIENSPNIAMTWGAFKQFLSPNQIMQYPELLSVQFKILGEGFMYNLTRVKHSHEELVRVAYDVLNQADAIIAHNGVMFDDKMLKTFFLELGLLPPAPYKVIDTFLEAKQFRTQHKSLSGLGRQLGLKKQKLDNSGFSLWIRCMDGIIFKDPSQFPHLKLTGEINLEAWDEMIDYGSYDILAMEELYYKLRPWIKNHPNFNLYSDKEQPVCIKCGSTNLKAEGETYTTVGRFYAMRCQDCGSISRERTNNMSKDKRATVITRAV